MDAHDALPFPRTDVALNTLPFVTGSEDPALFNHSLRTYLYGRFLGERQDLLPDRDYGDELLFLGRLLPDAGLSAEGNGDQRFDIDGADLAARFLTEQGLSPERIEVVWDAVALHLHYEIAVRKRPEIALVTAGAGLGLGDDDPPVLPTDYADVSMPGELVRQKTQEIWPTWQQLMGQPSGRHDYDGYQPKS
ncbi:damage-inducible protein [Streptomyces sp. NPDC024017]|uniref:damage-inducible protein n=1 Tax=Streptomyces sp. NPDC024017 TaxID=3154326 RepID=UPI0033C8A66E